MSSKALVSTIAIAAAVVVPAASAHTLSKAAAKREAAKAAAALAGGAPAVECRRRTSHAFLCKVSVVTAAGDVCVTTVRVAYRGHRDRTLSRRVVGAPACETPEIGGIL
jgi:hypothetical protein